MDEDPASVKDTGNFLKNRVSVRRPSCRREHVAATYDFSESVAR